MSRWKDGELEYVAELLASQGNPSVPRESVLAYLQTQLACGPGEVIPTHVDNALCAAYAYVTVNDWAGAAQVVKAASDAEALADAREGVEVSATYIINLTGADWEAIYFVGHRYAWSAALLARFPGEHDDGSVDPLRLAEYQAWELGAKFDEDTMGGHGAFPMLDPKSDLYDKLVAFWDGLV